MYGIASSEKARSALQQVERSMWQHLRESPRDNLDNEEYIIAAAFKDAISFFIYENKRLPKKDEFAAIKDEHLTPKLDMGNGYNFDADELIEQLGKYDWKQEYEQKWVMDTGEVFENENIVPTGSFVGSDIIGSATKFADVDFTTYLACNAASESALGSAKGLNKYNIDHPGL